MYTSKYCSKEINGGAMSWGSVWLELKEVVGSRNLKEFREETSDVIYHTLCVIYDKFGINLPMLGAGYTIQKQLDRHIVWQRIFEQNHLRFDKKYLINGSNYLKDDKVRKALYLARIDQLLDIIEEE